MAPFFFPHRDTLLRAQHFHLFSHRCWRQTLYSAGQLIRLGLIFFFLLLSNHPVVRHWVVTSMLYHSTWLYSELTWQLRAALRFRCSPSNLFSPQPASLFFSGGGGGCGGVVKCIIYPCLPPWSGNRTKRDRSPWIQNCTMGMASEVLVMRWSFYISHRSNKIIPLWKY